MTDPSPMPPSSDVPAPTEPAAPSVVGPIDLAPRPAIEQETPPPSTFKCHKCGTDLGYYVSFMRRYARDAECHDDVMGCWQPTCRAANEIDADTETLRKPHPAVAAGYRKNLDEVQRIPTTVPGLDALFGESPSTQTKGLRPGTVHVLYGDARTTRALALQAALPTRYDGPLVYIGVDRPREHVLIEMAARGVAANDVGDGLTVATATSLSHAAALLGVAAKRFPLVVVVDITYARKVGSLGAHEILDAMQKLATEGAAAVLLIADSTVPTALAHGSEVAIAVHAAPEHVVESLAATEPIESLRLANLVKSRFGTSGTTAVLDTVDGLVVDASPARALLAPTIWPALLSRPSPLPETISDPPLVAEPPTASDASAP